MADQDQLKKLVNRRHPLYESRVKHWRFLEMCYEGGRDWFPDNIFKYIKEGEKEYENRLERAYRFNHSREIVDLVNKYIFKMAIYRSEDAPPQLMSFWKEATKNKLDIREFMRQASQKSSTYGRVWCVIDSTNTNQVISRAEERDNEARIYAYLVTPEHVLDYSFDDVGELNWILIHEIYRDDENPLTSSGNQIDRFRLWDREGWTLIEKSVNGRKVTYSIIDQGEHNLGLVPAVPIDNTITDEPYDAPSLIGDIAYLDRANANYLSNLDAIIQDQTFSQLAMPAQGMLPGDDKYDQLLEMGTKRIFTFDGEHGAMPFYLSPDVKQAQVILEVINKIINEIYHTVGMAGERTKEDNAVGIDNSSGVAKAYDFERVNALLASKADSLELAENKIAKVVMAWYSRDYPEDLVHYPESFDVRGLYDEFDIASKLALLEAPDMLRREQMKSVVEKLFPTLKKELKDKIFDEIDKDWPPELELAESMTPPNSGGSQSSE